MKYTEEEKEKIFKIKSEIVDICKNCEGGFIKGEKCKCLILFDFIRELVYSRIAKDYWFLKLKELKVKSEIKVIVNQYIENINNAVHNKLGFLFYGANGTGKSSLMFYIGIMAIVKQKKVFYIRMKEIFDNVFEKDEIIKQRILDADIILLDEFDKVYQKSQEWNIHIIDSFIRETFESKAMIICTNFTEEEMQEHYGESIFSKMREFNKPVFVDGEDYRKELNKKWIDRLKKNIEYDKLFKRANNWHKEKNKKYKKEYDIVL